MIFRASSEEDGRRRKEDQKCQINSQCPYVNTNVIMEA